TGGADNLVKLWDVSTEHPTTFRDHKGWVTSIAFDPDGRRIVSGSGDRTLMLWDPATGRSLHTLAKHVEWVHAVAFSAGGRFIASCALGSDILLWDAATLQVVKSLSMAPEFTRCLAFSPDGHRLAVGSAAPGGLPDKPGLVRVWEVPSGRELST